MFKKNKKAFSIIEILIWIFVFSLWITSVYVIIISTLKLNDNNKNYIIATNLAREQIELVRNIRDSNYIDIKPYNLINTDSAWNGPKFSDWKKYIIENDYSNTWNFSIKVSDISSWFKEGQDKLNSIWMLSYKLCLDSELRYTYDCISAWNTKTDFYRYISIEPVKYSESWSAITLTDSFLLKSKVIWYNRWYHEFEVNSIIADWKRL